MLSCWRSENQLKICIKISGNGTNPEWWCYANFFLRILDVKSENSHVDVLILVSIYLYFNTQMKQKDIPNIS